MRPNQNLLLASLIALVVLVGAFIWQYQRSEDLAKSVVALQTSMTDLKTTVASLDASLAAVANTASSTAANTAELERRSQVVAKSQDTSLQDAVAKVSPAVVSLVESQEVPQLSVTYVNPFGDDPFYQGFGIQVPVYQQNGTKTQEVAAGTGFIVRSSGYIITNKHVVPDTNATYTALLSNGKQLPATVVWRSSTEDLAIVKIAGSGYSTVTLGNSSTLKLAESVFAIGNALGQYSNSVSVGVVSGLNRSISAQDENGTVENLTGIIQTDAAINPGNSGGPLVALDGTVVGVNVAMVQGSENIGFSLPVNEVKSALAAQGI